jgi:iron only hydrogenase large subunit-like protein
MLGFKRVFETSFSADLTIMEEASELVHRIKNGGVLPMMTSCSPGWIKYVEQNYPEFIPNLSTCKSPQQMLGAVFKSYFAEKENIDPAKIYSVSIMPCVAKKFECERPDMGQHGIQDIDAVLTTRELAELIRFISDSISKNLGRMRRIRLSNEKLGRQTVRRQRRCYGSCYQNGI